MRISWRAVLYGSLCALVGCVLTGVLLALCDVAFTPQDIATASAAGSDPASSSARLFARIGLFTVAGSGLGLVAALATLVVGGLLRVERRAGIVTAGLVAVGAAGLVHQPLLITFAGFSERQPEVGQLLYAGTLYGAAVATALLCAALYWAIRHIAAGQPLRGAGLALLLLLGAGAVAWGDLTILVALYARAHGLLEAAGWLLGALGLGLGCFCLRPIRYAPRLLLGVAVAALLWSGLWLGDSDDEYGIDELLALSRRHHGYATRMRVRALSARDFLRDPTHWKSTHDAKMDRLRRRYDLVTTALAPKWDLPRPRSIAPESLIIGPESSRRPLNVIVVFIDTLRADIAANPRIMPRLAQLRSRSLSFDNAYSTASDTVSALPVLTGGCYGALPCEGDILKVVRDSGVPSAIVIAKSARRFLAKQAPRFTFDDTIDIADYAEGKKVWGYGADRSSAAGVSQASLAWIDKHPKEPFMLWSFHFDIHNWMQLNEPYLQGPAGRHHIVKDERRWRYRAAAAGVDEALGTLLDGLAARQLQSRTALVVVSDHGEALGRSGHWQHAVYLWDTLIKVPLVVFIPGVAAARHQRPVGHVDVAPTIARLLDPSADVTRYHGYPLQWDSRRHDLPLLLFSMRKNDLLRIGVVSRQSPLMKLELPLDSVQPELYDNGSEAFSDLRDQQSRRSLALFGELVTSPVFPRPAVAADGQGDDVTAGLVR